MTGRLGSETNALKLAEQFVRRNAVGFAQVPKFQSRDLTLAVLDLAHEGVGPSEDRSRLDLGHTRLQTGGFDPRA